MQECRFEFDSGCGNDKRIQLSNKKISNGILGGEGEGAGAGVSLTWFDCILYLTDLNYLSERELRIVNSKL